MQAAVVIRDTQQQYEGLRFCIGLLLNNAHVQMFVLDHEIATMDEAYHDNMIFLDEMEGERFSNNSNNVENHGFGYMTVADMASRIDKADVVIPF